MVHNRPICRTVTDAVYLLDEIVGYDPRDQRATKSAASFIPKRGYKQFLKPDGLHGKRLGVVPDPAFSQSNGSIEAVSFEKHLATLR
jgi:amidase